MARVTRAARTRARARARDESATRACACACFGTRGTFRFNFSECHSGKCSFALDAARISRALRNATPLSYPSYRYCRKRSGGTLDYRDTRRARSLFVALPLISPAKIQRPAPRAARSIMRCVADALFPPLLTSAQDPRGANDAARFVKLSAPTSLAGSIPRRKVRSCR